MGRHAGVGGAQVLELAGVSKVYPGDPPVAALVDATLSLDAGEAVAIVGASGSGKSTLLNVMGTLERSTSGLVRVGGRDVTALSDDEAAAVRSDSIGFVFQQFVLLEHATALQNVEAGLLYAGVPSGERQTLARAALESVGLGHRLHSRPSHLSGGEQQRVAIARAVATHPAILLADEPTGNLDSASGAAIVDILLDLQRHGTAVVVVTHDRELALRLPRQIEVRDGRIVADSAGTAPPKGSGNTPSSPRPVPARLRAWDLMRVAAFGLGARRLRAVLSALGIAVGVAAVVAVLGLSASSQAALMKELAKLGTNLLTVQAGTSPFGGVTELPVSAAALVARLPSVDSVAQTGATSAAVYRSPYVPSYESGGVSVLAAGLNLPHVVDTRVAVGEYLNPATARDPAAVLGSAAATQLGIDAIVPGERLWLGNQWFYVVGILRPAPLTPAVNSSVIVGFPAAVRYLGFDGHPTELYVKANPRHVRQAATIIPQEVDPESPSTVAVSQPSAALTAQADADNAFTNLSIGLGAVALLVGAIGVANIMVIAVLERRREIGLRRALGATRAHIRNQFLGEAMVLSLTGGLAGIFAGTIVTALYASTRGWLVVIPPLAWGGGIGAALLIGGIAGFLPARRAADLSPTEALRSV